MKLSTSNNQHSNICNLTQTAIIIIIFNSILSNVRDSIQTSVSTHANKNDDKQQL